MLHLYPLMELYDMNTLMKKTVIGSALLLMVSASQAADVANAQPQPLTRPGALFSQADADQDGMDDAWEKKVGLDPANPEDRNRTTEVGYTALEVYLNSLVDESISYNFKK